MIYLVALDYKDSGAGTAPRIFLEDDIFEGNGETMLRDRAKQFTSHRSALSAMEQMRDIAGYKMAYIIKLEEE